MIPRRLGGGDEAYNIYVEEADNPLGRGHATPTKVALDRVPFRVFGNGISASVEDIEQGHTPVQLPPLRISGFPIKSV